MGRIMRTISAGAGRFGDGDRDGGRRGGAAGHDRSGPSTDIPTRFMRSPGAPTARRWRPPSFDNTVRLWDAATRKEIKKYEGHTKLVLAVAISPDGKHILSGSQDNTAKIWDFPTSGPVKTFAGHPARVEALAVKPDGKQFAAACGQVGQGLGPDDRGRASRTSKDTRAKSRAPPGAATAASSRPATRPTRSGSGKATSRRTRRSKHRPTACSAWRIFPITNSSSRRGRTGWPGSGSFRSSRRGDSRPRGRSRPLPSAATAPSWPPPGPTRSSASGTRPTASSIKEITVDQPVVAVAFQQDGSQVAVGTRQQVRADL